MLVVNLTWMETPSSDSIAQLVRGALLPFDARWPSAAARKAFINASPSSASRATTTRPTRGRLRLPWTCATRRAGRSATVLWTGSGDLDWLLEELSGGAKPKLPALLVYVRV